MALRHREGQLCHTFCDICEVPGMILCSGPDDGRVKGRRMSSEQLMELQSVSCVDSVYAVK